MEVVKRSGIKEKLDVNKIKSVIVNASKLFQKDILDEYEIEELIQEIEIDLYDGIETSTIFQNILHASVTRIADDPAYDELARNILLQRIYKQAFGGMYESRKAYKELFVDYIENAVELGLLDERMLEAFDLEYLAENLMYERDQLFRFNGLYNLMDRYLIKDLDTGNILEAPQWFWMRVAMGVSLVENEAERNRWAVEFYNAMSTMKFIPSTPTLFNAGTKYPQLSSCFIVDLEDDLQKIFDTVKQVGMLNKYSGGVGLPATKLRAKDSIIRSIQGKSSGIISFLKIIDETITAVSQGGRRRGSALASLEPWHMDIVDFVRTKRKWGDESQRFKNLKIAVFTNDEFMKRVTENADWYLFDPVECPKLVHAYGKKFSREYAKCIRRALSGKIRYKKLKAVELFREIIDNLIQNSEPWITFKDPINVRHPNKHTGTVLTTNLCTEQPLVSTYDSVESCNLGSLVLPAFIDENNRFDWKEFQRTIKTAVRFLDDVIDANYYAFETVERGTKASRKIGLGFMGFQDVTEKLRYPVDSKESLKLLDKITETMSYFAIESSCELAQKRGAYPNFEGSDWSRGILPIDTLELLLRERSFNGFNSFESYRDYIDETTGIKDVELFDDSDLKYDWDTLREKVKAGIRNACQTTIAPTATISIIAGTSQSFEPYYSLIFSRTNIAGRFLEINRNFVNDLKALGIWESVKEDVLINQGSIQNIKEIPDEIKNLYKNAFEIDTETYLKQSAIVQKWIDSAVSRNLYFDTRDIDKVMELYIKAWKYGLKSTYYAFMPAKMKTEGKYVHEDLKETKDKENNNMDVKVLSLDAVMNQQGYCESCGS